MVRRPAPFARSAGCVTMFAVSSRNVNRNPVTRAAAERVARRAARQEQAEAQARMAAEARQEQAEARAREATEAGMAAAARMARQEQADRMKARARAQCPAREAAEAGMSADMRRKARLERIGRFLMRAPRILADSADMAMLRLIAGRVCRFHGVTLADLCGPRRNGRLMLARQCVCYWARRRTGLSFSGIGRFLGNRHHSAILHAAREYPERAARARAARRLARSMDYERAGGAP